MKYPRIKVGVNDGFYGKRDEINGAKIKDVEMLSRLAGLKKTWSGRVTFFKKVLGFKTLFFYSFTVDNEEALLNLKTPRKERENEQVSSH